MTRRFHHSVIAIGVILLLLYTGINKSENSKTEGFSKIEDIDYYVVLSCGYIRTDVARSIFNPGFLKFISDESEEGVSSEKVQKLVKQYNNNIDHVFKKLIYLPRHFDAISQLAGSEDDESDFTIDKADLDILYYWYAFKEPEPGKVRQSRVLCDSDFAVVNRQKDPDLEKLLKIISKDPVGKLLVWNAVRKKINIKSDWIKGPAGTYSFKHKRVTIDKTVNISEFKMRFLVHELVHVANPSSDNSIAEEVIAEIISTGVQDRITDISIGCHPYVIFVDRLLDPYYGKLELNNDIQKNLRNIGINIPDMK